MTECQDCRARNIYRFNWGLVCCRVRFLRNLPSRPCEDGMSCQDAWLDRWRKQGQPTDEIERALRDGKAV